MLISEAFDQYKRNVIQFTNQSIKTEENHDICKRSLINYFGDEDIERLSFAMIRDWKEHLTKTKCDASIRNYIIKLRVVLTYLNKAGISALHPDLVPVPKRSDKIPVFLSKEQVAKCIDSTKRLKNKAIVSLLYASGIRISELCQLNRGCFHDKSFSVVGKGGKARLCFIDYRTELLINLYEQTREDNNPALFLTDYGKRITPGTVQETFKSIRKKTGIECHPHTMRHSFATNLLQTNTNLFYVSKMLGHSQLSTTQQYLHSVDFDLQKAYNEHHTV